MKRRICWVLGFAVFGFVVLPYWLLNEPLVTPYEDMEIVAVRAMNVMAFQKKNIGSYVDVRLFKNWKDSSGKHIGYQYKNERLNESVCLSFEDCIKHGIFTSGKMFARYGSESDSIVDGKEMDLVLNDSTTVDSVAFRFKSGGVLQVVDKSLVDKSIPEQERPYYIVTRIFFVGLKYKDVFPQAFVMSQKEWKEFE